MKAKQSRYHRTPHTSTAVRKPMLQESWWKKPQVWRQRQIVENNRGWITKDSLPVHAVDKPKSLACRTS